MSTPDRYIVDLAGTKKTTFKIGNSFALAASRNINTTSGELTGGGDLSADRTLGLANTAVVPTVYGSASVVPEITVDAKGRVTSAVNRTITPGGIGASSLGHVHAKTDVTGLFDYGITGTKSLAGGGSIEAARTIELVNDLATPGVTQYYGTNGAGTKGWFTLQGQSLAGLATTGIVGTLTLTKTGATPRTITVPDASGTIRLVNDIFSRLDLDASASAPSHSEGRLYWDSADHTVSVMTEVNGVAIQVGQEEVVRARNQTGATIQNGQVVYVSGASGSRPTISLALGSSALSDKVIGLCTYDIANNAVGYVTRGGLVRDLDTSAWSEGTELFVSSSVPGGLTGTPPTAPNHAVRVGIVLYSHAVNGIIMVHVDVGSSLNDLHDVYITSVADKNSIRYVSANARWENTAATAWLDTAQSFSAVQTFSVGAIVGDLTASRVVVAGASGRLTDGLIVQGSITGALTLAKTGSTARVATFPDSSIVVSGSASALTSGRVPFATDSGLLLDDAGLSFAGGTSPSLSVGSDTVPASGATSQIVLNGASGSTRRIAIRTAGGDRWRFEFSGAETGMDAGTLWSLYACNDSGAIIDAPLSVVRAAGGQVQIVRPTYVNNSLMVGATALAGGERMRVSGGSAPGTPSSTDVLIGAGQVKAGSSVSCASIAATNKCIAGTTFLGSYSGNYGEVGFNTDNGSYIVADFSSRIRFTSGGFYFQTAPSGSPGGAITFTSRVDIDNTGLLTVSGSATIGTPGAQSVLIGAGQVKTSGAISCNALTCGAITGSGILSVTHATTGDNAALLRNTHASGYGPVFRGGGGAGLYLAVFQKYDGSIGLTVTETGGITAAGGVSCSTLTTSDDISIQKSSATATLFVQNSSTGTSSTDGGFFQQAGLNSNIGNYEAGSLSFWTDGQNRGGYDASGNFFVTSSGSVVGASAFVGSERMRIAGGTAPGTPAATDVLIGAGQIKAGSNITGTNITASANLVATGGYFSLSGGANPYILINDGTYAHYIQEISGNLDAAIAATKAFTVSGGGVPSAPSATQVAFGAGQIKAGAGITCTTLTASTDFIRDSALGSDSTVGFNIAGLRSWAVGRTATAKDFTFITYDAGGSYRSQPFTIRYATNAAEFAAGITCTTLTANGNISSGGKISTSKAAAAANITDDNCSIRSYDSALGAGLFGMQTSGPPYAFQLQVADATMASQFPLSLNPLGGVVNVGAGGLVSAGGITCTTLTASGEASVAGLRSSLSTSTYWDGSAFQNDTVSTFAQASSFAKTCNAQAGGYDAGYAIYQTTSTGVKTLAGTIGMVGANSWDNATLATQVSDMYITSRNTAGAQVQRMRFRYNGDVLAYGSVGIGISGSPARPLDVYGSAQFKDASGIATTIWSEAVAGAGGVGTYTNHPFVFMVNGVEYGRINVGGAWGIGGDFSQPAASYHYLRGNASTDGSVRFSSQSAGQMLIESRISGTWTNIGAFG